MKNVVITILSILVLGLVCFIVCDKVINKEERKENNQKEITLSNLYGTYKYDNEYTNDYGNKVHLKLELTLNSDGTAIYSESDGYAADKTRGTYTYENNKITYTRKYHVASNVDSENSTDIEYNDGDPVVIFTVVDENTLQNTYLNQTVNLKKENSVVENNEVKVIDTNGTLVQTLNGYLSYVDLARYEIVNEINLESLSDLQILSAVLDNVEGKVINSFKQCQDYVYSVEDLKNEIRRIFGDKKEKAIDFSYFNDKTLNRSYSRGKYNYNSDTNELEEVSIACGAYVKPYIQETLVKAEKDSNDTIYLYKNLVYQNIDDAEATSYTVKYTYKSDNGKYYFESMKLSKNI